MIWIGLNRLCVACILKGDSKVTGSSSGVVGLKLVFSISEGYPDSNHDKDVPKGAEQEAKQHGYRCSHACRVEPSSPEIPTHKQQENSGERQYIDEHANPGNQKAPITEVWNDW